MSTVGGGVNIATNGLVLYLDPANTKSFVSGYLAPFLGNISNLILYNRVLTTSEILQNFNATRARFGL